MEAALWKAKKDRIIEAAFGETFLSTWPQSAVWTIDLHICDFAFCHGHFTPLSCIIYERCRC